MAGKLNRTEVKKLTSSQKAAGSVRILPGHVLVNEKYQGSLLVKVLQGSVNVVFENLGFMDFRPSVDVGVLFLNESELITGTTYKQRIIKLAKVQTTRALVLYEKTAMTDQYVEQLQKFTAINMGINLYPVSSQEEVAKFLIQMVNVIGDARSNPFLIKKSQKPIDQTLLDTLQTVPGLGEKKALALLQRFSSLKELGGASKQDISRVVGDACAQTIKSFFSSPPK
ncbi:Fanconi anemia core complex-associated protein 24-like isoform X2 [Dendronephthya gigantea]|uniref:Fanconi anemia core complex-associated protein 24-like n=1 Tax=Dendronephthya gigantea TaxID=151771 RepID=UPI00106B60A5|nr:Fanconi anemia core complex-associated protein 24-like [Dendronephthya gigantea]XP_028417916.1 Fanconi anemia core complex-associated protein 24-like isoform X2 [Dendronephthya gigantea]